MDNDPLERLLGELLDAYDRRLQTPEPETPDQPSRAKPKPRRRFAAAAALGAAVCASAAAAVVVTTQPSAPLSGTLPQLLGSRYALEVAPDLRPGHADWCITLRDIRSGSSLLPTSSTCVSSRAGPLVTSGGIARVSTTNGVADGWLLYAIVTKRVAELEGPARKRILPISSSLLPAGWRAAITIQTNPHDEHARIPALVPLSTTGARLRTRTVKPVVLPTRAVNPYSPATRCRIEATHITEIRLRSAYALSATPPPSLPVRPSFLSCYRVTFDLLGQVSSAALLLDAHRLGSRPARLPGFTRLTARADVWALRSDGTESTTLAGQPRLFARRLKKSWLILETTASAHVASTVLGQLRTHI